MQTDSRPTLTIAAIKLLHTVVWLFFVSCIIAVPVTAAMHDFELTASLAVLVLFECMVLLLNGWRCPISDLAARYTPETSPNFDIYLPSWLARHNKTIFGILFIVGGLFALAEWLLAAQ